MRLLDELYTKWPFYGSRRMAAYLKRAGRVGVGRRHIATLMRRMGLAAIHPGPRLSAPRAEAAKYPYLLRGVAAVRSNQIWSCDITYIRLAHGFVYLVAVIDWYSRFVLSWQLSITLDDGFCIEALERALAQYGTPEIFNSDQGSQFTSDAFVQVLLAAGCKISRDGRGRALDNIFVERLWRSVKYEEVYIKDYQTVADARSGLSAYLVFYNQQRLHQALGYRTPTEVYNTDGERAAAQS